MTINVGMRVKIKKKFPVFLKKIIFGMLIDAFVKMVHI